MSVCVCLHDGTVTEHPATYLHIQVCHKLLPWYPIPRFLINQNRWSWSWSLDPDCSIGDFLAVEKRKRTLTKRLLSKRNKQHCRCENVTENGYLRIKRRGTVSSDHKKHDTPYFHTTEHSYIIENSGMNFFMANAIDAFHYTCTIHKDSSQHYRSPAPGAFNSQII